MLSVERVQDKLTYIQGAGVVSAPRDHLGEPRGASRGCDCGQWQRGDGRSPNSTTADRRLCKTAALVAINGSIDRLCRPRFDSGACFAALLGDSEHGRWLIAPKDKTTTRVTRRYLDSSPILVTTFETTTGVVELVDFMPPGAGN